MTDNHTKTARPGEGIVEALADDLTFYIQDAQNGVARIPRQLLCRIQDVLRTARSSEATGTGRGWHIGPGRVAGAMDEDGGWWRSCTGCHETNEGAETGDYPYSTLFRCHVGGGCRECGGLGVTWEYYSEADFAAMSPGIRESFHSLHGALTPTSAPSQGVEAEKTLTLLGVMERNMRFNAKGLTRSGPNDAATLLTEQADAIRRGVAALRTHKRSEGPADAVEGEGLRNWLAGCIARSEYAGGGVKPFALADELMAGPLVALRTHKRESNAEVCENCDGQKHTDMGATKCPVCHGMGEVDPLATLIAENAQLRADAGTYALNGRKLLSRIAELEAQAPARAVGEIAAIIRAHVRLVWRGHDHADIDYRSTLAAADAILAVGSTSDPNAPHEPCDCVIGDCARLTRACREDAR